MALSLRQAMARPLRIGVAEPPSGPADAEEVTFLDVSSPLPLYHQLERVVAERIAKGHYGDGLPSEPDLGAEFGVSRGTVRQALDCLARAGLIVRCRGRGSFVAPVPIEYPFGRFYRFAHEISERGMSESSEVLAKEHVGTPGAVARRLGLAPGARSLRIVRLRHVGERPLLLEISHIPNRFAAPLLHADLSHGSIYDVLEDHGVHLTRMTEDVQAVNLDGEQANHFGVGRGAPALALDRLAWAGRWAAEHRWGVAPSDRVSLTATWGAERLS
jgi:GntR family transcriptional regulator